jgi:hypothetical protein
MERLALVVAAGVVLLLAVAAVRTLARRRTARARAAPTEQLWGALGAEPDGRSTVVTFSTPSCAECRTQTAILDPLANDGVRVLPVDAAQKPDVARAFGILTVPSTAVLEASGALVAVNHGLADGARLREQLAATPEASAVR